MRKKTSKHKKKHKSRKKPVGLLARFFHGFAGIFANGLTLW